MTHSVNVLSLTHRLVRLPSITPTVPQHRPACNETLNLLEGLATAHGATCHRLTFAGGDDTSGYPVENLFAYWRKGNPKWHLCFLGHTDVVPVGDEAAWTYPPFGGEMADGFIYGRGATDMKGAVAAFVAAACNTIGGLDDAEVSALITTDEEWAAINGTTKVLGWMKEQGIAPDAFLVGEPSSPDQLGTHVKLGRRGSLTGKLVATGVQGHIAYPGAFVNPQRALALAMSTINTHNWADGDAVMPASQLEFVVVTGGNPMASNIIPQQAEALFNIRFTPQQTPAGIGKKLTRLLHNPPAWAQQHPDAALLRHVSVQLNITTASLPYLAQAGALMQVVAAETQALLGITPTANAAGGTTDGRFVHQYFPAAEVLELGPPERGGLLETGEQPADYHQRGGMHQVDERISMADLRQLERLYRGIIQRYSTT